MTHEEHLKRINEIIAERFHKIEERVHAAQTVADLFEQLLDGIEKEFNIPFVWISLADHDDAAPLIEDVQKSDFLQNRFSVVSPELLDQILSGGQKPVLANKDLLPFYRLLPPSRKYFVKSIAVIPFVLNGRVAGTWNNGDADESRYHPDMKTDLIESLAGQISQKLTCLITDKDGLCDRARESEPAGGFHD